MNVKKKLKKKCHTPITTYHRWNQSRHFFNLLKHSLFSVSGGEDVDLYLKSAIEGVVIKWATQINDVITKDSAQAFSGGQNPDPSAEICFWNSRLRNLEYIYDQLRDERVRKMAVILETTDSAYFPSFKTLFHNIVAGKKKYDHKFI